MKYFLVIIIRYEAFLFSKLLIYNFKDKIHIKIEFWDIFLKSSIFVKLSFAISEDLNFHFIGLYSILTQSWICSASICIHQKLVYGFMNTPFKNGQLWQVVFWSRFGGSSSRTGWVTSFWKKKPYVRNVWRLNERGSKGPVLSHYGRRRKFCWLYWMLDPIKYDKKRSLFSPANGVI